MSEDTAISWCDSTFNPWIGCTKVSPACDHCYAERLMDTRLGRVQWGAGQLRKRTSASAWRAPLRWNNWAMAECRQCQHRFSCDSGMPAACLMCGSGDCAPTRRRVFCASLGDVFDNEVPTAWRIDLLRLMEATPNLDWLLLTKRIGNVDRLLDEAAHLMPEVLVWPSPNVWLGATICSQEEADRDIPKLLRVPARVRFLSIEPMLGPVDLTRIPMGDTCASECCGNWRLDVLKGASYCGETERDPCAEGDEAESRIDWVICGGESGPQARPMHPGWVRSLRDQCAAAGVPFHFKQWGEWAPTFSAPDRQAWFVEKAHRWPIEPNEPSGGVWSYRIGTKAAGRLLDGVEHNGWPA